MIILQEKVILDKLIKNRKFENISDLYNYLETNKAVFNLDIVNGLINKVIDFYKDKPIDREEFQKHQILINKIVNNENFESTYNPDANVISLLEMVRVLTLILKERIFIYLSGCLDVNVGIVEINKNGLKVKHFAYQGEYQIGDLIYIDEINPNNFHLVSDYYTVSMRELLQYIVYVSSKSVYKFDTSYKILAKYNIKKIKDERLVKVIVGSDLYICSSKYEVYDGEPVEVNINGEFKDGFVYSDILYNNNKTNNYIFKRYRRTEETFKKERRNLTDVIIEYLYNGWSLDSFKASLEDMDRKKYVIIFSVFEKIIDTLDENKNKKLNEIEDLNLYYRPFINYLLKKLDINSFYYKNNGVIFSLLSYLSLFKKQNNNALNFLLDEDYDLDISVIDVNLQGTKKRCFAYDKKYIIGEPIFIQINDEYPVAFIHDVKTIKFKELIKDIEYYISSDILSIVNLKEHVKARSSFDNKIILINVYDGKQTSIAISNNYVPYIGENLKVDGKNMIVISEPLAVDKDNVDYENYKQVDN